MCVVVPISAGVQANAGVAGAGTGAGTGIAAAKTGGRTLVTISLITFLISSCDAMLAAWLLVLGILSV